MTSPVDVRLHAAQSTPTGFIVPSGVESFKASLKGAQAVTAFNDWRHQHFTKKLFLALQDLILHQPREVQSENMLVQLGVTQGLVLAAQLVSDPSVLWPDVFGDGLKPLELPDEPSAPTEDYNTSIDQVVGGN